MTVYKAGVVGLEVGDECRDVTDPVNIVLGGIERDEVVAEDVEEGGVSGWVGGIEKRHGGLFVCRWGNVI